VSDSPIRTSAEVNELYAAMSKAQAALEAAVKDAKNPYYHSTYATLATCFRACRQALADHGLAILQTPVVANGKILLVTRITHSSGQWHEGDYPIEPMRQVKDKGWESSNDPQSIGSAVTYARRYALCSMLGIPQEDDDGNGASRGGRRSNEEALQTAWGEFLEIFRKRFPQDKRTDAEVIEAAGAKIRKESRPLVWQEVDREAQAIINLPTAKKPNV